MFVDWIFLIVAMTNPLELVLLSILDNKNFRTFLFENKNLSKTKEKEYFLKQRH